MKKFLIPLLAFIALPNTAEANWFGKYKSRAQAIEACYEWGKNSREISYYRPRGGYGDYKLGEKYSKLNEMQKKDIELYTRKIYAYCKEEEVTNQILGYGLKKFDKNIIHNYKTIGYEIIKNFRY